MISAMALAALMLGGALGEPAGEPTLLGEQPDRLLIGFFKPEFNVTPRAQNRTLTTRVVYKTGQNMGRSALVGHMDMATEIDCVGKRSRVTTIAMFGLNGEALGSIAAGPPANAWTGNDGPEQWLACGEPNAMGLEPVETADLPSLVRQWRATP